MLKSIFRNNKTAQNLTISCTVHCNTISCNCIFKQTTIFKLPLIFSIYNVTCHEITYQIIRTNRIGCTCTQSTKLCQSLEITTTILNDQTAVGIIVWAFTLKGCIHYKFYIKVISILSLLKLQK